MPRSPLHPPVTAVSGRRAGALAAVVLCACLASGCAPEAPPVIATSTPAAPTGASTPTATPAPSATVDPEASAAENLPVFSSIVAAVWEGSRRASGRAYIDALAEAGFDKSAMEVTPDASTVGNPAESIQFSVRWGQECLVGQVGPATGEPVAVVAPVLDAGRCLVGDTRPIDW
ncbi:DUF6993 domain-containing protein [Microbacterium aureliae]